MGIFVETLDRNVIPRWRDFRTTLMLREVGYSIPSKRSFARLNSSIEQHVLDWNSNRSLTFATDLLGAALVLGQHEEAHEAALFVLEDHSGASPLAREIAYKILNGKSLDEIVSTNLNNEDIASIIRKSRRLLQYDLRSAIVWTDLALAYTIVGKTDQAERALIIARSIAPENQFVLRSYARFLIHLNELDRSHHLLRNTRSVKLNPWILSAEIAVANSAGRTSHFIKDATRLLSADKFEQINLTELASALATLEMNNGNDRKARKLFRQSMIDPTDNSIAQAEWSTRRINLTEVDMDAIILSNQYSFEARAFDCYQDSRWEDALTEAKNWQIDQPFSSRPAIMGSFIAGVTLSDFNESERIARLGLQANKRDFSLLNNLAFALINQGKINEAKLIMSRIAQNSISRRDKVVLNATMGLLRYREGYIIEGRKLYTKAISLASSLTTSDSVEQQGDLRLRAFASIFFAFEELRSGSKDISSIIDPIYSVAKKIDSGDIKMLLEKFLSYGQNISL